MLWKVFKWGEYQLKCVVSCDHIARILIHFTKNTIEWSCPIWHCNFLNHSPVPSPPPLPSLITLWNNSNITWLGGESSIITTLKGLSVHFILFKILLPNKKKTKHTKSVLNHNLKLGQCLKSTVFYMTITTMAEGCNNKFKNGIYPFNQMIIRETLVNIFPWEKSRHCTKKSLKMSAQYVTSVWIFSILFSIHFPQCC